MLKDYELLCNAKNHWDKHQIHQESLKIRQTYMSLLHYFVMHLANPNAAIHDCIEEVEHKIVGDHSFKHLMNVRSKHINKYSKKLTADRFKNILSSKERIDYRIAVVVDSLYLLEMIILDLTHNRIAFERLPVLVEKLSLSKNEREQLINLVSDLFEEQDKRFSNEVISYLSIV